MGQTRKHRDVLLISAMFSKETELLDWACQQLTNRYGKIALASPDLNFDQTKFYENEMGSQLIKRFVAFEKLVDPSCLPAIKLQTNQLEIEPESGYNASGRDNKTPRRSINIDPGYLTEAKLVLMTTKDRDHRIYLGQGIYGEITLYYQRDGWKSSRWTYPDYCMPEVIDFLMECRHLIRQQYQRSPGDSKISS